MMMNIERSKRQKKKYVVYVSTNARNVTKKTDRQTQCLLGHW